jgi:prophage maintenance system killer protein
MVPMASALNYLTVQDVLWINLQLTNRKNEFDYDRVEEATYYQYGYGGSLDLPAQAGRLLTGFRRMRPFPMGNDACALVSTLAFLRINGARLNLTDEDALEWTRNVWDKPDSVAEAVREKLVDHHPDQHHGEVPAKEKVLDEIFDHYPQTIKSLLDEEAKASLA